MIRQQDVKVLISRSSSYKQWARWPYALQEQCHRSFLWSSCSVDCKGLHLTWYLDPTGLPFLYMTKHIHELCADWFLHVFHYYNISSADGLSVEEDLRDSQMSFPYSHTLPVLLRYNPGEMGSTWGACGDGPEGGGLWNAPWSGVLILNCVSLAWPSWTARFFLARYSLPTACIVLCVLFIQSVDVCVCAFLYLVTCCSVVCFLGFIDFSAVLLFGWLVVWLVCLLFRWSNFMLLGWCVSLIVFVFACFFADLFGSCACWFACFMILITRTVLLGLNCAGESMQWWPEDTTQH